MIESERRDAHNLAIFGMGVFLSAVGLEKDLNLVIASRFTIGFIVLGDWYTLRRWIHHCNSFHLEKTRWIQNIRIHRVCIFLVKFDDLNHLIPLQKRSHLWFRCERFYGTFLTGVIPRRVRKNRFMIRRSLTNTLDLNCN